MESQRPLRQEPPELADQGHRRRKQAMLAWVVIALVCGVGLFVIFGAVLRGSRISAQNAAEALQSLKSAQREWWDSEALSTAGCSDAKAAFESLRQRQREWWERQALVARGQKDGSAGLAKLEEMQRAWWQSEGLDNRQPHQDAAAALARLEEINKQWWAGQSLGKTIAPEKDDTPADSDRDLGDLNKDLGTKNK